MKSNKKKNKLFSIFWFLLDKTKIIWLSYFIVFVLYNILHNIYELGLVYIFINHFLDFCKQLHKKLDENHNELIISYIYKKYFNIIFYKKIFYILIFRVFISILGSVELLIHCL